MKKKDILNLIKLHFENDNAGFIEQSNIIAKDLTCFLRVKYAIVKNVINIIIDIIK